MFYLNNSVKETVFLLLNPNPRHLEIIIGLGLKIQGELNKKDGCSANKSNHFDSA